MRNSGVIGRVHHETMNKLFQIGFFPNVKDMQSRLEDFRDHLIERAWWEELGKYNNLGKLSKLFTERPYLTQSKYYHLRKEKLGVAFNQLGYPILADAAFALNDINKVLEIIRVAKRTGNTTHCNVFCNDKELQILDDVINNSEYYLELDKIIEEEINDIMEELNV